MIAGSALRLMASIPPFSANPSLQRSTTMKSAYHFRLSGRRRMAASGSRAQRYSGAVP